jgi:hypothetical protein
MRRPRRSVVATRRLAAEVRQTLGFSTRALNFVTTPNMKVLYSW